MARSIRYLGFGLVLMVAACQALPSPPVTPTPSPTPTAGASSMASAVPTPVAVGGSATAKPTASPTAAAQLVSISGMVYDDTQTPLNDARIDVSSLDAPGINQTIRVFGGAYILAGIPLGSTVTLKAYKDNFGPRFRTYRTVANPPDSDIDYNKHDFGGTGDGLFYALSQYPDITTVSPATKTTGVTAGPLDIVFNFSHPFNLDAQNAFSSLLQVDFPLAYDQSGKLTHALLGVGTTYDNKPSTLTFDSTGRIARFHFDGPLVSRSNAYAGPISIQMAPDRGITAYPKSPQSLPLGQGPAPLTYDGSNGIVPNRIAPFLRPTLDTLPTTSPVPTGLALWGAIHMTTSVFNLAQDTSIPKVTSVVAQQGSPDSFIVTFDHPMRAFPEAALDGSAIAQVNYRYLLGKRNSSNDVQAFNSGNPAVGGTVPGPIPLYSASANNVVVVQLPGGTFAGYQDFKFYVAPTVKDAAGIGIKTSNPDPTTSLADNIIQGTIQ